jgi:hypothetical protein
MLDIIHRPHFYLKHNASETGFCLRLQVSLLSSAQQIALVSVVMLGERERECVCVCETNAIFWVQLGRFHLKTETVTSHRSVAFQIKVRTMDNVQNVDSYINIPPSQTYRF